MPIALSHIRDELMPGLMALQYSFRVTEEIYAANFLSAAVPESLPLSIPQALACGAAAAVIANPEVTRRGLLDWLTS